MRKLLFILLSICTLSCKNDKTLEFKILIGYLYKGEVYTMDIKTRTKTQITFTDNKVEEFQFSPDSNYLAYSKIAKYVDFPSFSNDSITPQFPVYTIVIYDLNKKEIIREFTPGNNEFYNLSKWVNTDAVEISSGDGMAYDYSLIYKVNYGTDTIGYLKKVSKYGNYFYISISNDVKLYNDSNEFVHLTDIKHKNDVVIFENKDYTRFIALSNDRSHFLWSEASQEFLDKNSNWKREYYKLYIRDLSKNEDELLLDLKNVDMGLFDKMSFSPNNKFISIDYYKNMGIMIMDLKNKSKFKISGYNANWINSDSIVFSKGDNLSICDINSRKEGIILKNIKDPEILIK